MSETMPLFLPVQPQSCNASCLSLLRLLEMHARYTRRRADVAETGSEAGAPVPNVSKGQPCWYFERLDSGNHNTHRRPCQSSNHQQAC